MCVSALLKIHDSTETDLFPVNEAAIVLSIHQL
jgi:hypothetical protein